MLVSPGNLTCYDCTLDFRLQPYNSSHHCLGVYGTEVSKSYLVNCGPNDLYCKVSIMHRESENFTEFKLRCVYKLPSDPNSSFRAPKFIIKIGDHRYQGFWPIRIPCFFIYTDACRYRYRYSETLNIHYF